MGYSKEGSQVVSATEGRIAVYGNPGPLEIEGGGVLSGFDLLVDRGDDATLSLIFVDYSDDAVRCILVSNR
jgi:hypothetical protein